MTTSTVGTVINVLVIAAYTVGAAWRGYVRRKAHWSAGSWAGFGATMFSAFALVAFALFFSAAVDQHATWVGPPSSDTRGLWVLAALGAFVGGGLVAAGTLAWFALGDPAKPFPFFARVVTVLFRRYRPRLERPRVASLQPNEEL